MSYGTHQQRRRQTQSQPGRGKRNLSGLKLRLMIAAAIVLFSVVSYFGKSQLNPITKKHQRVAMTVDQEVQMGLQAAPEMGPLSRDREAKHRVSLIGRRLVNTFEQSLADQGITNPYQFDFHLLANRKMVNAFALPGGQVFITEALYWQLLESDGRLSDGQLAGVLGHEIGHVIERHGNERMAQGGLIKGIANAAGVAGGDVNSGRAAAWVGNIVNMKYGREAELESDKWGVKLMALTGYNPEHLMRVMDVLEKSSGGAAPPEFLSTHPRPANRRQYIAEIIKEKFPNGMPPGLE